MPADDGFGIEDGQGHQQRGCYIDQDEGRTAVFAQHIGKTPDVAQAHGAARHGRNDRKTAAETLPGLHRRLEITSTRMPAGAT